MSEPYRYACPEGHRTVTRRGDSRGSLVQKNAYWRCETCAESYDTVTDLKTGREIAP